MKKSFVAGALFLLTGIIFTGVGIYSYETSKKEAFFGGKNKPKTIGLGTCHMIDESYADSLIRRYYYKSAIDIKKDTVKKGIFFDIESINNVIGQNGCNGVRFYPGVEKESADTLMIMVGTSGNNFDDIEDGNILVSKRGKSLEIKKDIASGLTTEFQKSNQVVRGYLFLLDAIKEMNNTEGLVCYFGRNNCNINSLVVFEYPKGTPARAIDMSFPCPKDCGKTNVLNNYQ